MIYARFWCIFLKEKYKKSHKQTTPFAKTVYYSTLLLGCLLHRCSEERGVAEDVEDIL